MITVDGHTFNEKLIRDGWIIDAGCRGWLFGKAVQDLFYDDKEKNPVYAVDIESFSNVPRGTVFRQAALTCYTGEVDAYFFGDGTGNFIRPINETPENSPERPCETRIVPAITLDDIYKEIGTDIDLLKLDIEGSEYEVMMQMEPIPKQISVETHQHCHWKLHDQLWPQILEKMCEHYNLHLFNVLPRYHYLDCLFIRKDIA